MMFTKEYFTNQYKERFWRKRGDKHTLNHAICQKIRRIKGTNVSILEIGCGEGYLSKEISKLTKQVISSDISFYAVKKTKSDGIANCNVANAEYLPYQSKKFDVIFAIDVVEHLPHPEQFIAEAKRVAKDDAIILISTPNPQSYGAKVKGQEWFGYSDPTHVSIHTAKFWKDVIEQTGFMVLQEGTDTLWDIPYSKRIPKNMQWLFFIPIKHFLNLFDIIFPWTLGENYICIAKNTK